MGRFAATICTEPEDIGRLEQLVSALPAEARVRIVLREGDTIEGTVVERPALQLFEDADGTQGMNAMLRLDVPSLPPPSTTYVWLSEVRGVEPLDTPAA
jgi:hypothetical protein